MSENSDYSKDNSSELSDDNSEISVEESNDSGEISVEGSVEGSEEESVEEDSGSDEGSAEEGSGSEGSVEGSDEGSDEGSVEGSDEESDEEKSEEGSEEEKSEEEEKYIYSNLSLDELKSLIKKKRSEGIDLLLPVDEENRERMIEALLISEKKLATKEKEKILEPIIANLKNVIIPEIRKRDALLKKSKKSQSDKDKLDSLNEKYGDDVTLFDVIGQLQAKEAWYMIAKGERENAIKKIKEDIKDLNDKKKLLDQFNNLSAKSKPSQSDKKIMEKLQKKLQGLTSLKLLERIEEKENQLSSVEKGEFLDEKKNYKKPTKKKEIIIKKRKITKKEEKKAADYLEKMVTTKPHKKEIVVSQEASRFTQRQMDIFDAIKRKMSQPLIATKETIDVGKYVREYEEKKEKVEKLREVYPVLTAGGYVEGKYVKEMEEKKQGRETGKVVTKPEKAEKDTYLLSLESFNQLKQYLEESLSEKVEIEASLGKYVNGYFRPGVTLFVFGLLRDYFSDNYCYTLKKSSDIVRIIQSTKFRQIIGAKKRVQQKTRESKYIKAPQYGIKISKSMEGEFDDSKNANANFDKEWSKIYYDSKKLENSKKQLLLIRTRNRETYQHTQNAYKVELTRIKEEILFEGGRIETYYKNEVEIEVTGDITPKVFSETIETILSVGNMGIAFKDILTEEEKETAIEFHNDFFEELNNRRVTNKLSFGYLNEPRNISLNDLFSEEFETALSTVKLNGKRTVIMADTENIYMCTSEDIFKVGTHSGKLNGCLIDCEYMKESVDDVSEFKAFDILFCEKVDVRDKNVYSRRNYLKNIINKGINLFLDRKITLKHFEDDKNDTIYEKIRKTIKSIDDEPKYKEKDLEDGILIQTFGKYKSVIWKWKPEEKLTIDFLFVKMTPEEQKINKVKKSAFWVKVKDGRDIVPFIGSVFNPFKGWIIVDNGLFLEQDPEGRVVECKWDKDLKTFVPERYRDDKPFPNASSAYSSSHRNEKGYQKIYPKAADNVWKDIHNPISKRTIQGFDMKLMRKYHMDAKRSILKKYFSDKNVLAEFGAGRGGMMGDWGDKKVYAIEPDKTFMNIFKERLAEFETKEQEIENKKAEKENRIPTEINKNYIPIESGAEFEGLKEIIHDVDGITAFFSLTFFPENKEKYFGLLNNISLLPKGGIFAGIVMDGNRTIKLLDEEREKQNIFNKPITFVASDIIPPTEETTSFSIKQLTTIKESKTGVALALKGKGTSNKIKINIFDEDTMVKTRDTANVIESEVENKDYTEWLFFFNTFKVQLEERGFKLLDDYFLDENSRFNIGKYKMLPSQSKTFSSLNRVFVFERIEII